MTIANTALNEKNDLNIGIHAPGLPFSRYFHVEFFGRLHLFFYKATGINEGASSDKTWARIFSLV